MNSQEKNVLGRERPAQSLRGQEREVIKDL